MRRLNPMIVAAIVGLLALLLVVYVFSGGKRENPDKLTTAEVTGGAAAAADPDPEQRCGAQATYDLIKRELFRRAAQARGGDQAQFDNLANYSVARVDSPQLADQDEDVGRISCSGSLALALPPGLATADGQRTITGDIEYALQPAADGTGQVLALSNADALIDMLASVNRAGSENTEPPPPPATSAEPRSDAVPPVRAAPPPERRPPPPPARPAPPRRTAPPAPPPEPRKATPPPPPPPRATARPSFNCGNARTRGEIAVCNDSGLASLDRQMSSQFYGAMSQGNAAQRAILQRTRNRFLAYRDRCRSDACIAGAYRDRMREISDIMAGRWRVQ